MYVMALVLRSLAMHERQRAGHVANSDVSELRPEKAFESMLAMTLP